MPLSKLFNQPVLLYFKIYLGRPVKDWSRKCRGMGIAIDDETLFTLFFADDQVIVAAGQEDASYMLKILKAEYDIRDISGKNFYYNNNPIYDML